MDTRSQILDAAYRLIQRSGAASLTIEAVAKEAGLSKGGVLYHFSSKQKLIEGMLEASLSHFEQEMQKYPQEGAGAKTRAYVEATFDSPAVPEIPSAIMAAIATDASYLRIYQDRYQIWQAELNQDGLSPERAMLLRLAADGLWMADIFGLSAPTGEAREKLRAEMLRLAGVNNE
ncbi:TetR/AcrR family transcriptional regulator [Deinococcus cellulosilyticus]|uniref:TetR family transcriptional regulator n=1 Tax=Deinococcus cellulosilyticus (strain DSM 18568 / NBRC 106333 / KACC 11606 / 5516J-15) TaxID=1223518 RepID=A0A511MXU6_DEIC1|nr:TetR/AcrR family transcriptional regulator [Deinococcus cellulosilyticus]GEM45181.1 TetR family transcriptional regulator [Deinococcus cellulosilyticus NBRC 106333 = KACC 11606]